MVGFRDLVGTGIAPVSKETAVKIGYVVEIVAHQALVYDYVNPLGGKGPFFLPLCCAATIEGQ